MSHTKKSHRKKHRVPFYRRPLIWLIFAVSAVAVVAFFMFNNNKPSATQPPQNNPAAPVTEDSPAAQGLEEEGLTGEPSAEPAPPSKVTPYEGENPNQANELTGAITLANVENGVLTVMVEINQFLADGGTCTLTLTGQTKGGKATATNAAFADIQTSACETFQIPVSNLASDTYNLEIRLSGNNKNGIIKKEIKL